MWVGRKEVQEMRTGAVGGSRFGVRKEAYGARGLIGCIVDTGSAIPRGGGDEKGNGIQAFTRGQVLRERGGGTLDRGGGAQ